MVGYRFIDFIVNLASVTVWSGMGASYLYMLLFIFPPLIIFKSQDLSRKCSAWKGLIILSCERGVP